MHLVDKRNKHHPKYPEAGTPGELEMPPKGNRIYYDSGHKDGISGFGCRVTAGGARSFVLNYRINGRERRYTIGDYPDYTVTAARAEAAKLKRKIREEGHDPLAKVQADREAPTVADLCERYIERHLPKKRPRSQKDDRSMIEHDVLPVLKNLKVNEVTYDHIDKLHHAIKKRAPYRANRVVALLSKMFNLGIKKWNMRDRQTGNPCEGIERNPETKRKRYLKPDELARLMTVLDDFPDKQAVNIVRLLLLTGARFGEVAGAKWEQLDLDAAKWTKPGAETKQKTEHEVPLSPEALQLLQEIRAEANEDAKYVFPGRNGVGYRVDLKKPWPAICKAAHITGLRIHDLRHSYASLLISAGQSLSTVGALLGHTQPITTHRYAHLLDDPLRKATGQVGALIRGARKSASLLTLRHRKR